MQYYKGISPSLIKLGIRCQLDLSPQINRFQNCGKNPLYKFLENGTAAL